tara:strand:+ start:1148 stop:1909 length:762 start_codon:yes stop_codon:yes gene_type:complete
MGFIATPVSHLAEQEIFFETVLPFGCLEGRDHYGCKKYSDHVLVYHSDLEITREWTDEQKVELQHNLMKYPNLLAMSFHMVTCFENYYLKDGVAFGIGIPMTVVKMLKNSKENCTWLKNLAPKLDIMLENNNDLGTEAYHTVTQPEFINQIIKENNIHFLYDHAHALISSFNQKRNFNEYFKSLPLDKVMQVHFSEPTFIDGLAVDAHNLPSAKQFEFCIEHITNSIRFYTIEFYQSLSSLKTGLILLEGKLK